MIMVLKKNIQTLPVKFIYLWSFIVYIGKDMVLETSLFSNDIIKKRVILKLSKYLFHKSTNF